MPYFRNRNTLNPGSHLDYVARWNGPRCTELTPPQPISRVLACFSLSSAKSLDGSPCVLIFKMLNDCRVSSRSPDPPKFHCVHSIQSLDFLHGSVLVFFVIKIEKSRTRRGAVHIAAPPSHHPLESHANLSSELPEGTAPWFAEVCSNLGDRFPASDVTLGPSSRVLTSDIGSYPRPDGPLTTSCLVKMLPFLPGSGSQVESDVAYRKHRGAYQSTRGQNLPLATFELTHIFASNNITNRGSRGALTPQSRPSGSPQITMFVPESHHV
jgi:hypothetical protein